MRNIKRAVLASTLLVLSGVSTAATVALGDCGRTAETFAFITDASGSMMETIGDVKKVALKEREEIINEGKPTLQKHFFSSADEAVDGLTREALAKVFIEKTGTYAISSAGMKSCVQTVGPFTNLIPCEKRTVEVFIEELNNKLPVKLEVFGRTTWIGDRAFARFSKALTQSQATVLITDGNFETDEENGRRNPVETLKRFYEANPGACIHIVSAAYTQTEREGIEKLAAVSNCARVESLERLVTDEALWKNFVEEVFYKDCSQVETVEIRGVNFAFDKSLIGENGRRILDAALKLIAVRDPSETITIRGWTDWTGSDAYNAALSQRRAEAVKMYFVKHGVDPNRLKTEGMGKSFKYTNRTGDGRWMNRRVDLLFGDSLHSTDTTVRTAE